MENYNSYFEYCLITFVVFTTSDTIFLVILFFVLHDARENFYG